jgi:hypothetical protein
MDLILGILIGILLGVSITILSFKSSSAGKLHIITDKEDGSSYMFLDLDESVKSIRSKKFATFEITQK